MFLFLYVGCSDKSKTNLPLARVGHSVLLEKDLRQQQKNKIKTDEKAFSFIENWVTEEVLLKEAIKEGFQKDVFLKKERDLFYKKLMISSYLENKLLENITISRQEVINYYNSSKGLFFRKQDEVFVHHFFSEEIEQSRSIKRELLKKNNKRRDKELNEIFKLEPKLVKKGFSIKEIDKVLFQNKKLGVVGPIRSDLGFHVFNIIKRYENGSKIGLESSYDEIYQRLLKKKTAEKKQTIIDSLKSKTNIFINSKYKKKDEN